MNFLIIIKDTSQQSKNILQTGAKVANAFSANLSIIHVGKKSKAMIEGEVSLARITMGEWNILHPGIEVLNWAYETLKEFDTIEIDADNELRPVDYVNHTKRIILSLPQSSGRNVELILREGEMIEEISKDIDEFKYDLAILGCPKKKRSIHQVVQFFNTSVLLVKNFQKNSKYKIQLCVDDSRATKRSVIFGAKIAMHYKKEVKLLTVSKTNLFKSGYRNAHRWAQKYLKRAQVDCESLLISGNPVDIIITEAGDDHIIIMGKAKKNEFFKYIWGSKPIHVAQKANAPVLLIN
jgi:nucleotide-binding universal stress UspA family protein